MYISVTDNYKKKNQNVLDKGLSVNTYG